MRFVFAVLACALFPGTTALAQSVDPRTATQTSLSDEFVLSDDMLAADVLFIGGYHGVHTPSGELALARQHHDFTGYVPISGRSDSGYVIVNHEQLLSDPLLGDGGGMTVFTAWRDKATGRWSVVDHPRGKYRSVDFSDVGGTLMNCGGFQTSWGTVLTAEEYYYESNLAIYRAGTGITDTSDFTVTSFNGRPVRETIPRHLNFGWMVEVDPATARAVRKHYNMGRYGHEGGALLPDGRTVILTDDSTPGYLFRFVADQAYDLSSGRLYVYRQGADGNGGDWLELPMNLHDMIRVRERAAALGATVFLRTEWAVHHNGKVYFTETGNDDTGNLIADALAAGARLSRHLQDVDAADGQADGRIRDYYGRILELDVKSGQVRVYLEGGAGQVHHLANPDGLALTTVNGRPVIFVNEDLNGFSHGRVPSGYTQVVNEIFALPLDLDAPTIDDLHKLAIGPDGCETTGGRFTPDGSTFFVNVQHPKSENRFPFNNAVTLAVRHVDRWIAQKVLGEAEVVRVESSTVFRRSNEMEFPRRVEFMVFNTDGLLVLRGKSKKISFYGLARGTYQLFVDDRIEPLIIR